MPSEAAGSKAGLQADIPGSRSSDSASPGARRARQGPGLAVTHSAAAAAALCWFIGVLQVSRPEPLALQGCSMLLLSPFSPPHLTPREGNAAGGRIPFGIKQQEHLAQPRVGFGCPVWMLVLEALLWGSLPLGQSHLPQKTPALCLIAAKADGDKWKHLGNRDSTDGKWTGMKERSERLLCG